MIISNNSQLGLRFKEPRVKRDYCKAMVDGINSEIKTLHGLVDIIENNIPDQNNEDAIKQFMIDYSISDSDELTVMNRVSTALGDLGDAAALLWDNDSKYYLICQSVYEAAGLIKVGDGFTSRVLKGVNEGKHTYLIGKSEMVRFVCYKNMIKGAYYNDVKAKAFWFGLDIESGEYYFQKQFQSEFSRIMQVMTFVELGDVEVTILTGGKNNGKTADSGKITNTSNKTVYVVDSTWNKLLIRTDGFAVRGHFRLQPCGDGMKDRKLIWISAFEKHGYKRRPKAEILNNSRY